jgi:hypothetical protein
VIVVGILDVPGQDDDLAVEVARRAAATGARVEMIGVVPGDSAGDRRLAELAGAGIGHATVTRTSANGIEPADLELALRYLPDVRAIVLVRPDAVLLPAATAAASWTAAELVIIGPDGAQAAAAAVTGEPSIKERPELIATDPAALAGDLSADAIVLDPPSSDPEGTFAGFVAALAIRLDAGEPAGTAWSSTVAALAVDPVR